MAPAWSANGKFLAVALSGRNGGPNGIFIFQLRHHNCMTLTTDQSRGCLSPVWSPKGDQIAITAISSPPKVKPADREVWVVDILSNRWRQVTHLPLRQHVARESLTWSPDGRQIAFIRYGKSWETTVWVTNVDGTGLRQLTTGKHDVMAVWSPDGRWVAFLSSPPWTDDDFGFDRPVGQQKITFAELHLIHPDGTGLTPGLAKVNEYEQPSWSPNSKSLYYTRLNLLLKGSPKLLN